MTKDRVVVGKIESWLVEFESWATTSGVESSAVAAHMLPHARTAAAYDF
jgi:hypothetical protein